MAYILCYTKKGEGLYTQEFYHNHTAYNCDWEHAMHLAVSEDGRTWTPLRNNTGVLFPKCSFTEGRPQGTTKTLLDPWLFRNKDGSFLVSAVRRNQNAPDPLSVGCLMLFSSRDLVRYKEAGFLKLSTREIRHPRCEYDPESGTYRVEWQENGETRSGSTYDFCSVQDAAPCADPRFFPAENPGIEGCVPGNIIEVTAEEDRVIRSFLDEIRCVGVAAPEMTVKAGDPVPPLPKALCLYSDGSTHQKPVDWDADALARVDTAVPGEYRIPGRVKCHRWPFPFELSIPIKYGPSEPESPGFSPKRGMSDPCITKYKGKYYLSSSGNQDILLRCADRIEDVFSAPAVTIHQIPLAEGEKFTGTWAAELHEIHGVLYMLTGRCPGGNWIKVHSVMLRCNGDPMDPAAWEAPRVCVKPNGKPITQGGISLDMTWFEDGGRDYVMWSDRKILYGTDPLIPEPADIYIATVNPEKPWQATCEPVCVLRPIYGWDRYETEVDEGPYMVRHGDELFVTISGSSTGMADLYDVGVLRAHTGADLLDPDNWDWIPYPLLTKESVENQFGPGHNNFVKDPETGDDIMVYHAVPHEADGRPRYRQPGLRRVHWGVSGLPYLEMTPDRDLPAELEDIVLTVKVK